MRVIDFFDRGVLVAPARACLKDADETLSYREVQAITYRLANVLIARGLRPEGKAAVYSSNSAKAFQCVLGIFRAGGAWVPINYRSTADDNAYIIDNCDIEVLFFHSSFVDQVEFIRRKCLRLRMLISIDKPVPGADFLSDLLAEAPETDPDIPTARDAVVTIFSSGGTTGLPKGVQWTNGTWETIITTFHVNMPARQPAVHLVVAPMTHAAGVVAMPLFAVGATQVILPAFDAAKVAEAIEREKVSHLFLPPTAIYSLLAYPGLGDHSYRSLEYFIYAAAPMSVKKLKECISVFGPVMAQTFGQAEAPMYCTYLSPQDHMVIGDSQKEHRLASCGRPTLSTRIAIMDDAGNLLPRGEVGEIVVRGSLVMSGYYKNPEATKEASAFGWHHTGDIGRMDEEGYVFIVDRKKDMIISGGFNVYPSEVEQVIWSHPRVQDCAVIGVPDEKWGEAVTAVIELKEGESLSADEVMEFCKQRLGSVKTPKNVEFWSSLPRTAVGKVRKKDIRDQFWRGQGRRI